MSFDMAGMLQKARQMQQDMEKMKEELKKKTILSESGGGMVKIKMTCTNEVKSVQIADELIQNGDKDMLQDLLVAAFNNASKKAEQVSEEEMNKLRGNLPNIPGLNLGL